MPLRIEGDQLEQHRIKLERDIANTIPSPPTMSPGSMRDDGDEDVSSVDFPRHNSNPRHSFHSFEHPSQFDSDFYSRHGDEDSVALDPELGHTMSTAAHHASALTLTAGLHGRNYTPGKLRQSNQEFDPDRPLQPMLHAADGLSIFDSTVQHSKTKSHKSNKFDQYTFDPIIVDSTGDLDRFLKTGFRQPNVSRSGATYQYLNRSHSEPGPGVEVEGRAASPKSPLSLSQALGSQFSPKRPRSTPLSMNSFQFPKPDDTSIMTSTVKSESKPTKLSQQQADKEKENKSLPSAFHGTRVPQSHSKIHFQEPDDTDKTPKARKTGFADFAPDVVSSVQRPALKDKSNKLWGEKVISNGRSRTHVHLPDVTDLTAAVESPLKGDQRYRAAKVANRRFAADVVAALDGLQSRLEALERENGVSRRRVKELEYDLEECKADVARERKKMKARDSDQETEPAVHRGEKGRNDVQEEDGRYRNAVEEKKTLEAFISTMREHVARLTAEVALHRSLIDGLRQDVDASDEIQSEVQTLNAKIERLSGEVERLKAFIEEGVRERQRFKDVSAVSISRQEKSDVAGIPSQIGVDLTYVTNPLAQGDEQSYGRGQMRVEDLRSTTRDSTTPQEEDRESLSSESEESPFQEPEEEEQIESLPRSVEETPTSPGEKDQDHPGEITEQFQSRSQRYINDAELTRVRAEILERRSERSMSSQANSNGSRVNDDDEIENLTAGGRTSPARGAPPAPSVSRFGALPMRTHPSERDGGGNMPRQTSDPLPSRPKFSNTAFPQIRGSRMERLFFAARDHDAMICHVCHRKKRRDAEFNNRFPPEEEERFLRTYINDEGARRGRKASPERKEAELPQTILVRVLREMEDDFSHYKAIYLELAEQYAVIDAVSNVAKRNVLADHLREVIDSLEQKGDQIAALYGLLQFQDKPLGASKSRHATFA